MEYTDAILNCFHTRDAGLYEIHCARDAAVVHDVFFTQRTAVCKACRARTLEACQRTHLHRQSAYRGASLESSHHAVGAKNRACAHHARQIMTLALLLLFAATGVSRCELHLVAQDWIWIHHETARGAVGRAQQAHWKRARSAIARLRGGIIKVLAALQI